jgi:hypothetical protein
MAIEMMISDEQIAAESSQDIKKKSKSSKVFISIKIFILILGITDLISDSFVSWKTATSPAVLKVQRVSLNIEEKLIGFAMFVVLYLSGWQIAHEYLKERKTFPENFLKRTKLNKFVYDFISTMILAPVAHIFPIINNIRLIWHVIRKSESKEQILQREFLSGRLSLREAKWECFPQLLLTALKIAFSHRLSALDFFSMITSSLSIGWAIITALSDLRVCGKVGPIRMSLKIVFTFLTGAAVLSTVWTASMFTIEGERDIVFAPDPNSEAEIKSSTGFFLLFILLPIMFLFLTFIAIPDFSLLFLPHSLDIIKYFSRPTSNKHLFLTFISATVWFSLTFGGCNYFVHRDTYPKDVAEKIFKPDSHLQTYYILLGLIPNYEIDFHVTFGRRIWIVLNMALASTILVIYAVAVGMINTANKRQVRKMFTKLYITDAHRNLDKMLTTLSGDEIKVYNGKDSKTMMLGEKAQAIMTKTKEMTENLLNDQKKTESKKDEDSHDAIISKTTSSARESNLYVNSCMLKNEPVSVAETESDLYVNSCMLKSEPATVPKTSSISIKKLLDMIEKIVELSAGLNIISALMKQPCKPEILEAINDLSKCIWDIEPELKLANQQKSNCLSCIYRIFSRSSLITLQAKVKPVFYYISIIVTTAFLVVVFSTVGLVIFQARTQSCPKGMNHFLSFSGRCYSLHPGNFTLQEARSHCKNMDASLIEMPTKQEYDFIRRSMCFLKNSNETFWIGLTARVSPKENNFLNLHVSQYAWMWNHLGHLEYYVDKLWSISDKFSKEKNSDPKLYVKGLSSGCSLEKPVLTYEAVKFNTSRAGVACMSSQFYELRVRKVRNESLGSCPLSYDLIHPFNKKCYHVSLEERSQEVYHKCTAYTCYLPGATLYSYPKLVYDVLSGKGKVTETEKKSATEYCKQGGGKLLEIESKDELVNLTTSLEKYEKKNNHTKQLYRVDAHRSTRFSSFWWDISEQYVNTSNFETGFPWGMGDCLVLTQNGFRNEYCNEYSKVICQTTQLFNLP